MESSERALEVCAPHENGCEVLYQHDRGGFLSAVDTWLVIFDIIAALCASFGSMDRALAREGYQGEAVEH